MIKIPKKSFILYSILAVSLFFVGFFVASGSVHAEYGPGDVLCITGTISSKGPYTSYDDPGFGHAYCYLEQTCQDYYTGETHTYIDILFGEACDVGPGGGETNVNSAPVITLLGANPMVLTVGQNFVDPGATAHDAEDGDITSHITKTGTVNTGVPGSYTITYNVFDSQQLSAVPVSRTVVVNAPLPLPSLSFNANPTTGHAPLNTTLTWVTGNNPTSCVASGGWSGQKNPAGGSEVITGLVNTTVFTLTCYNSTGNTVVNVSVTPTTPIQNQKPIITLLGNNPLTLNVGQNYVDPGATAFDQEDGDITSHIVKTGTVNTAVVGTYTVTYNVLDSQGLSANPVTRTVVVAPAQTVQGCSLFSNTENFIGSNHAVLAYTGHNSWIQNIPGASWIWSTYKVLNPLENSTVVFENDFLASSVPTYATLTIAADNQYLVKLNGNVIASSTSTENFATSTSYVIPSSYIVAGTNIVTFKVINTTFPGATADLNPAGLLYRLDVSGTPCNYVAPVNHQPVITLLGANPLILTMGQTFVDPGATATDIEDGDLTSHIVKTGTVDTSVAGTTILSYSVSDSQGFAAIPLSRIVIVSNPPQCLLPQFTSPLTVSGTVGVPFNYLLTASSTTLSVATSTLPSGLIYATSTNSITGTPSTAGTFNITVTAGNTCGINTKVLIVIITPQVQPQNQRPVITLLGSNPATVNVGQTYTDPGATATDAEDGNITSRITATSTVNINIAGTYTVTYNVSDSQGLSAIPVSRTVNVLENVQPTLAKLTVCLVLANDQNSIATSSYGLPTGTFNMRLATTSNIASSTLQSKTWNSNTFTPNSRIITSSGQDAECVSYENLPLGSYYYSQLGVTGSRWNVAKYNDQDTQPVNNVFDFFSYGTSTVNADGTVSLDASRRERTLVLYDTYNPISANHAPVITLIGENPTTLIVGQTFVDPGATATDIEDGDLTSHIVKTGTVSTTTPGTYTVTYNVSDSQGLSATPVTRTVVISATNGGGNTPSANISVTKTSDKTTVDILSNITYTITVINNGPNNATNVTATDLLPAGLTLVSASTTLGSYATTTGLWTIGNLANGSSTELVIVAKVNSGTEGQKITNSVTSTSSQNDPVPNNNSTSVDVTVNTPITGCVSNCGGGGGGGGGGGNIPVQPVTSGGGGSNGPIVQNNLTIFNEQVIETVPGIAFVTWNTNLPATRRTVYGNTSVGTLLTPPNYGYDSSTELVSTPLLTAHAMAIAIVSGKTYYFRPVSSDSTRTVTGKELTLTASGAQSGSCYYLYDYLRKDFNNNPVEVKKLQIFLRDLEGYTDQQITGIYDDATIVNLDAFQDRYKPDILTPWGHTAPTGYTYILTKKKVNEIYCKQAFPVTPAQQAEIDAFRHFLESLQNAGIDLNAQNGGSTTTPIIDNTVIGIATTTVAGLATAVGNKTSQLTANIITAGKDLANFITNLFSGSFVGFLNLLLIILIIVIIYLWYREYEKNKKLDQVNKEIDLNK